MIFDGTIHAGDVISIGGIMLAGFVGFALLRRDVADMKDELRELRKIVTNQAVLEARVAAAEHRMSRIEERD